MLLVEATINGTLYYISMEGIALTHYWDAYVVRFDPPQYQMTELYGGYIRPGFGIIAFSHDLFASEWPPPANMTVSAYYTATTEASKQLLFTSITHLKTINREVIEYEFYSPSYTTTIPEVGSDLATNGGFASDTAGWTPDANATLTSVAGGYSGNCLKLASGVGGDGYCYQQYASFVATKMYRLDFWVKDIDVSTPKFTVHVNDQNDMTGIYWLEGSASTAQADWKGYSYTFEAQGTTANIILRGETSKNVYFDSVALYRVTDFDDTLVNVATWFCNAARLNLTLDSTYARAASPTVKFTLSGEQIAVNLLSDICAFFTHMFYISSGTLYLIDMLLDAGSMTITEFDFFPSEYFYEVPIAIAKTDNYVSTSSYPYGSEVSFPIEFINTQAEIEAALANVITVMNLARCNLRLPFIGSFPTPGKKVSWTDTSLGEDTDVYIRARTFMYDFENEEVIIEGEGVLTVA